MNPPAQRQTNPFAPARLQSRSLRDELNIFAIRLRIAQSRNGMIFFGAIANRVVWFQMNVAIPPYAQHRRARQHHLPAQAKQHHRHDHASR